MIQVPLHALSNLTQVVRRDTSGHTNCNTLRPVHQEIWEPCRQYRWLLVTTVVVVNKVNCLFVNIANHLHSHGMHATLRITRSSGA